MAKMTRFKLDDEFGTEVTETTVLDAKLQIRTWTALSGAGKRKAATLTFADGSCREIDCNNYDPRKWSSLMTNAKIVQYAKIDVQDWNEKRTDKCRDCGRIEPAKVMTAIHGVEGKVRCTVCMRKRTAAVEIACECRGEKPQRARGHSAKSAFRKGARGCAACGVETIDPRLCPECREIGVAAWRSESPELQKLALAPGKLPEIQVTGRITPDCEDCGGEVIRGECDCNRMRDLMDAELPVEIRVDRLANAVQQDLFGGSDLPLFNQKKGA